VIFMHPTDWAALSKIKTQAGSAVPLLSPSTAVVSGALNRQLFGIAVRVSVQVTDDGGNVTKPSFVTYV
jgi:hypothetical protein